MRAGRPSAQERLRVGAFKSKKGEYEDQESFGVHKLNYFLSPAIHIPLLVVSGLVEPDTARQGCAMQGPRFLLDVGAYAVVRCDHLRLQRQ